MAPESPANLVLVDLSFEDKELRAAVSAVERTHEARSRGDYIYVAWSATTQPTGFSSLGDGSVYLRETPGIQLFNYPARPDTLGDFRYAWRYGTSEATMVVIVFPRGYIAKDFEPSPLRAKVTQSGRLAVYWIFRGTDRDDAADVKWTLQEARGSVEPTVLKINRDAPARRMDSTGPIMVDNKRTADAKASILLGGGTLAYLMLLVFFGPSDLPPDYKPIIRFIAAIGAGMLSYFFVGSLYLGGKMPVIKTQVAAVGGFAIFIFVMIFWSH